MTLRIKSNNIEAATLATLSQVKISTITVTDSSFNPLDDLAVDVTGGYLKITGTGFVSGCTVVIGTQTASAVTFVSSTEVRVQIPAQAAGSYILYLVNPDGATAIRVNAVNYSATPTWETASTLAEQVVDTLISIQLSANSATTYSLAVGSTLPAGLTLSNVGLLSGTVTGITDDTTYSFTVVATDAELQDSPRTFSVTITTGDVYGMNTVLLLQADGVADGAQNNTFVDSSTNNFTITRNGNTTQGSFSPYGSNWSNYFNNQASYLTLTHPAIDTGDFCFEMWVYPTSAPASQIRFFGANTNDPLFMFTGNGTVLASPAFYLGNSLVYVGTYTMNLNTWYHVAVLRQSGICKLYINGNLITSGTSTNSISSKTYFVGSHPTASASGFIGYISNFRSVVGSAVYTSNFTPSTTPLTAISGTSLLTCQSNRFIDNSTNNFTLTTTGDVRVTKFSPFALSSAYSAETYGGSGYFDGTGDYLTAPTTTTSELNFSTGCSIEGWSYITSYSSYGFIFDTYQGSGSFTGWWFVGHTNGGNWRLSPGNAADVDLATPMQLNQWNHWVLTNDGSRTRFFVNGVLLYTALITPQNVDQYFVISTYGGGYFGSYPITGYLSGMRFIKGAANIPALYQTSSTTTGTAIFTPPTAPVTAVTNTGLLLNFTNAGIVDNSTNNTLETLGNAQISTAVKKYGTGSIYFDGTGDYLFSPANINYAMGTGDFTIELWYYPVTTNNTDPNLMGNYNSTWQSGRWAWHAPHATYAGKYSFWVNNYAAGSAILVSTNSIVLNQWVHLTITRSGNTWRMFINGTIESTTTSAVSLDNGTGGDGFWVGANFYPGAGGRYINAYVDDLRITRGIARYTANFTPLGHLPAR